MKRKPYKTSGLFLVVVVVLITATGLASAAVAGDFTSSYDGYDDGDSTDVRGHEIQVDGDLDFTGENAVNVKIKIKPTRNTILDKSTVELNTGAESSVSFNRRVFENMVRYDTDEVPAGKEFPISFVVYPVSGLDQSEIKSAEIEISYDRPNGDDEVKTIPITTSLNNTAPQVISRLEEAQNNDGSGGTPLWMQGLAGVGGIAILYFFAKLLLDGDGPPGTPP